MSTDLLKKPVRQLLNTAMNLKSNRDNLPNYTIGFAKQQTLFIFSPDSEKFDEEFYLKHFNDKMLVW